MGNISRKDFFNVLRVGAKTGVVAGLLGAGVDKISNEYQVLEKGLFEHDGVLYQSVYEEHSVGPEIQLHPNVSGVFVEMNWEENFEGQARRTQYDSSLEIMMPQVTGTTKNDELLYQAIKDKKIPFAIGDVYPIGYPKYEEDLYMFQLEKDQFFDGLLIALASMSVPSIMKGTDLVTRREFLHRGTAGIIGMLGSLYGAWLTTGTGYFHAHLLGDASYNMKHQNDAKNRLPIRISGMVTNLHPEKPGIFTRNLVMALKMKQFARYLKSQNIDKPIVAFNVGALHSGIEDFITLPDDILRQMIVMINQEFVGRGIMEYGVNYSKTRIAHYNQAGEFEEIAMLDDLKLHEMLSEGE